MAQNTRRNHMVTHLAFIIKNGKKQKTLALNNRKRRKAKSTQKKQKHTYLIDGRTYISNTCLFMIIYGPFFSAGQVGPLLCGCLLCIQASSFKRNSKVAVSIISFLRDGEKGQFWDWENLPRTFMNFVTDPRFSCKLGWNATSNDWK